MSGVLNTRLLVQRGLGFSSNSSLSGLVLRALLGEARTLTNHPVFRDYSKTYPDFLMKCMQIRVFRTRFYSKRLTIRTLHDNVKHCIMWAK